ncbi:hypothetical protein, partial [Nostoc sp.]
MTRRQGNLTRAIASQTSYVEEECRIQNPEFSNLSVGDWDPRLNCCTTKLEFLVGLQKRRLFIRFFVQNTFPVF